jgi:hypothetical protein
MPNLVGDPNFHPTQAPAASDRPAACRRHRDGERRSVALPVLLTWKDRCGATRRAYAVTRNVSRHGVYIECSSDVSIPLYRLVRFQLKCHGYYSGWLPAHLCQGEMLSVVYRVTLSKSTNEPGGLALRLIAGSESNTDVPAVPFWRSRHRQSEGRTARRQRTS